MKVYYNENDAFAAAWLRRLIEAGLLPDGEVDERSIVDVRPHDLRSYRQCHFFAGIGGWPYAITLAGWPEDREVWTGSCPCQPLSVAGQQKGHADQRHLWPAFHRLVAERRPAVVFGEQVAGKDGLEWFAGVRADLEAGGYACGAAIMPAAAVGAPHRRERLWWGARLGNAEDGEQQKRQGDEVLCRGRAGFAAGPRAAGATGRWVADAASSRSLEPLNGRERATGVWQTQSAGHSGGVADASQAGWGEYAQCDGAEERPKQRSPSGRDVDGRGDDSGVADAERRRPTISQSDTLAGTAGTAREEWHQLASPSFAGGATGLMAHSESLGPGRRSEHEVRSGRDAIAGAGGSNAGVADAAYELFDGRGNTGEGRRDKPSNGGAGFWSDAQWLAGPDGKARRVKPGVRLLASGVPNRVGRLRGYGNAIVPQLAAEFIAAFAGAMT
jgi:DNA (cytosine-5)-methyltransferase 1